MNHVLAAFIGILAAVFVFAAGAGCGDDQALRDGVASATDTANRADGSDSDAGELSARTSRAYVCADAECCPAGMSVRTLTPGLDAYFSSVANECVVALAGNDFVGALTSGARAFVGGDGDDVIQGSEGPTTVWGGSGRDTIVTRGAADLIDGGDGDDIIDAGLGDDIITPGAGRDTVMASIGDDTVIIRHVCEFAGGETIDGSLGYDVLVLPVPLAEAQALGLNVAGFEEVVVDASSECEASCANCPPPPDTSTSAGASGAADAATSASSATTGDSETTATTTGESDSDAGTTSPVPDDEIPPPFDEVAPEHPLGVIGDNIDRRIDALLFATPPSQFGFVPDAFVPTRRAVVSGRVIDVDGEPLVGVRVRAVDSPEFGYTRTRRDGSFDFVIHGGAATLLEYDLEGFFTVQRTANPGWRHWDDVGIAALTAIPVASDFIDFASPVQTARGELEEDADGPRQAVVYFPSDASPRLEFADGRLEPLESLTVRVKEYTVGGRGPLAMPATLPPSSAYTYAVELAVDEVDDAGAEGVAFERPVHLAFRNFLDFPVGTTVPVGRYDRRLGAWLPEQNGVVARLLPSAGPVPLVDFDGDGVADDPSLLELPEATLAELAQEFGAGDTFWLVPLSHFTPIDANLQGSAPPGAGGPISGGGSGSSTCTIGGSGSDGGSDGGSSSTGGDPGSGGSGASGGGGDGGGSTVGGGSTDGSDGGGTDTGTTGTADATTAGSVTDSSGGSTDAGGTTEGGDDSTTSGGPAPSGGGCAAEPRGDEPEPERPECEPGSVINCDNRTLGETIPVQGTGMALHYNSQRSVGRKRGRRLTLQLTGAEVPESLQAVLVQITYGGKTQEEIFTDLTPSMLREILWDYEAYGPPNLNGRVKAEVRIGYAYQFEYRSFGSVRRNSPDFARSLEGGEVELLGENSSRGASVIPGTSANSVWWGDWSEITLSVMDFRALGFGGWTLSHHHAFDPETGTIFLGTGSLDYPREYQRVAREELGARGGTSIDQATAGSSLAGYDLRLAREWQVSPDGARYFIARGTTGRDVLFRVASDGTIARALGGGAVLLRANGQSGVTTGLELDLALAAYAIDADGSIVFQTTANTGSAIWRMDPTTGVVTQVAGVVPGDTTSYPPSEPQDGANAVGTRIDGAAMSVGRDGSVYFVSRVRPWLLWRVTAAGRLQLAYELPVRNAGGGTLQGSIVQIATLPTGELVLLVRSAADEVFVERPDGSFERVAGTTLTGARVEGLRDGGPANGSTFRATDIGADEQGRIVVLEAAAVGQPARLWRVSPAGRSELLFTDTLVPATSSEIGRAADEFVAARDGRTLLFGETQTSLARAGLGFSAGTGFVVPSADGALYYAFDRDGRHLETRDALTSALLWSFEYEGGLLTAAVSGDGERTLIERTGVEATAIVSADGWRTGLEYGNGYLTAVRHPEQRSHELGYSDDGLLIRFQRPNGPDATDTFEYDELGELVQDTNATGVFKRIEAADTTNGYTRALVMNAGRLWFKTYEEFLGRQTVSTRVNRDGTTVSSTRSEDQSRTVYPDGTEVLETYGDDPRFGRSAERMSQTIVRTPGGLQRLTTVLRTSDDTGQEASFPVQAASTVTLDVNGRRSVTSYDRASNAMTTTSPEGRGATLLLDALGRARVTTVGDLLPVEVDRDARGRVTAMRQGVGGEERALDIEYDAGTGRIAAMTDALGRQVSFEYLEQSRRVRQLLPDGRVIEFRFDDEGNLVQLAPPGRPGHEFTYGLDNAPLDYLAPDLGQPRVSAVEYDLERRPLRFTRPDGDVVAISYDPQTGRAVTVDRPVGQLRMGYDAAGRLTAIEDDAGVDLTMAYDGSLLVSEAYGDQFGGVAVQWVYDNNFWPTAEIAGGFPVSFERDRDGMLRRAGDLVITRSADRGAVTGTGLGTVSSVLEYDGFGDVQALRYGTLLQEIPRNPSDDPTYVPPVDGTFECASGQVLPAALRCEGTVQCLDGSDEVDCCGPDGGNTFETAIPVPVLAADEGGVVQLACPVGGEECIDTRPGSGLPARTYPGDSQTLWYFSAPACGPSVTLALGVPRQGPIDDSGGCFPGQAAGFDVTASLRDGTPIVVTRVGGSCSDGVFEAQIPAGLLPESCGGGTGTGGGGGGDPGLCGGAGYTVPPLPGELPYVERCDCNADCVDGSDEFACEDFVAGAVGGDYSSAFSTDYGSWCSCFTACAGVTSIYDAPEPGDVSVYDGCAAGCGFVGPAPLSSLVFGPPFVCASGDEVPAQRVCDGVVDCPSGDDESSCGPTPDPGEPPPLDVGSPGGGSTCSDAAIAEVVFTVRLLPESQSDGSDTGDVPAGSDDPSPAPDVCRGFTASGTGGVCLPPEDVGGGGDPDPELEPVTEYFGQEFERDALGRIVRKLERVLGEERETEYGYDETGRLVEVREAGELTRAYVYDANSNRLAAYRYEGGVVAEVEEGSYNAQDVLEAYGSRSYRWDAAGDLEEVEDLGTGARLGLEYDALGNLRAATLPDGREVEYLVDARNRRVGVVVDGVSERVWVYSGQLNPVLELRPDGGRSRFVYGTRSHVPEYMERDGERYRLVTDHLGSVRLVVNVTTGLVAQRLEYGPWGEVEADTNPGFQPFGYAGGLYDRHTGLVRFGARDYDPSTGRWTAKDPIRFDGGMNHYLYVSGDPTNAIDPSGLIPMDQPLTSEEWRKFYGGLPLSPNAQKWIHDRLSNVDPAAIYVYPRRPLWHQFGSWLEGKRYGAITLGANIYADTEDIQQRLCDPKTPKDYGLLAHETLHVHQWTEEGASFFFRYAYELLTVGYPNISYEKDAYKLQDEVIKRPSP